jgi:imidazolonepropionase-like amidohydrolase
VRPTAPLAALVLAAGAAPALAQTPAPTTRAAADSSRPVVVLRAARMFDGTGAALVRNAAVVVTGDRITAAGPAASIAVPAGARVVDLGDATLLPGFIDAHVHIAGRSLADPRADGSGTRDLPAYLAVRGVDNARRTLMAGFTAIRTAGSGEFADVALKQAIDEGVVAGPRIQPPRTRSGSPAGHCDDNGFRPTSRRTTTATAPPTAPTRSARRCATR